MSRIHNTSWHHLASSSSKKTKDKTNLHSLYSSSPADQSNDQSHQHSVFDLERIPAGLRWPQTFFVPVHYEQNYQYPLIVWLHNDGFNENQLAQVMPHVSTQNYVATGVRATRAIDSLGHRFEWRDSCAAVDAACEKVLTAIDEVSDRYSIHQQRIVLAGYMAGGTMALRLALRDPHRFAGVVALGGRMPEGKHAFSALDQIRESSIKMLWQNAIESPTFQQSELVADIRQGMFLRCPIDVRNYKTDDVMNTDVLADINRWVMNRIVLDQPFSGGEAAETIPVGFSDN